MYGLVTKLTNCGWGIKETRGAAPTERMLNFKLMKKVPEGRKKMNRYRREGNKEKPQPL